MTILKGEPVTKKYVIYRRVSTKRQGDSGLGLEAQVRDIELFLANYSPEPYEVLATFTDVKSGRDADRQALKEAIELAREHSAEILCSKLDRVSRDVAFVATLLKDKRLKLRVASMPHADTFQLHIYAALAEQEREFISIRTKQSLAAAKTRGVKLGGMRDATMKRNAAAKDAADNAAQRVSNIIIPMRDGGATLQGIADALNTANVPTPRNRQWAPMSVKNALDRLKTAPPPKRGHTSTPLTGAFTHDPLPRSSHVDHLPRDPLASGGLTARRFARRRLGTLMDG